MIHHYSIPVSDPKQVAAVFAELFEGTITDFGPYAGAYIVWFGDKHGTAIEFYPAGTEMIPDEGEEQANFIHNPQHSGYSATHAAISIDRTQEEILALAERLGWRALELSRGGYFRVIEFWIENKIMLELLTPDMSQEYLAATQHFAAP